MLETLLLLRHTLKNLIADFRKKNEAEAGDELEEIVTSHLPIRIKLFTLNHHIIWLQLQGISDFPYIVTDSNNENWKGFATEEKLADWLDAQIFTVGYVCAIQNLLSVTRNTTLASTLIKESNMPEQDFIDAQESSGYMNKLMQEAFELAFPNEELDD